MGFNIETSVPVFTVFLQGVLSFFSPCILPLVPLYVSYLSGGVWETDEKGAIIYPRRKILINTLFFVVGVSFSFFLLGLGATALGEFLGANRSLFARISGIIMIIFGLYQLGVFGQSTVLGQERRLPFLLEKYAMGPVPALVLGFTFSFAWTPCVGPILSSVLLMAGSTGSSVRGFVLIGVYTLGFVLPFLAVGVFTGKVLDLFKKHRSIVGHTVKIGAGLLIVMGVMTFTGLMNGMTSYLSKADGIQIGVEQDSSRDEQEAQADREREEQEISQSEQELQEEKDTQGREEEKQEDDAVAAPDFTLLDQYGNEHTLSAYKGKTVFLNFWATWCPPCRGEMPEIQKLYENYGLNKEELVVLGVAAPGIGQEGDASYITAFLEENGYTFPVVMDESGFAFWNYGIQAYPTTFMIDKEGNVYGYVEGALTGEIMESIVKQTIEGK